MGRAARAAVSLALVLSAVAMPSTAPGVQAQGLGDRISTARQRQASLQRVIDRQQNLLEDLRADQAVVHGALQTSGKSLAGINADQAAVRREVNQATAAIAKVQARRDSLVGQLHELDYTLDLLEQQIAEGEQDLEQRRRLLGERLAEAYRSQGTTLLEQVLADRSFSDVISEANAYLSYGEQDAQLAQDIAADQRALDSLRALTTATRYRTDQLRRGTQDAEADIRLQKERLAAAKEKLERLEEQTKAIREAQMDEFQKAAGSTRKQQQVVAAHAAAERRLERKIAGLVAEAKRRAEAAARARRQQRQGSTTGGTGGGGGSGIFTWPATGLVTQEFGCTGFGMEPPRGSCAHFHDGIDIANGNGTPVRAPGDGVVAFVGWNPYDGSDPSFMVVIGHAGGYTSRFMHLQGRSAVSAGQSVRRGQVIGYMGNTGNSTGTHLHWEVYRGETPINPRSLV